MPHGPAPRSPRARVIAAYLPQFHPIPENDIWWGDAFTEWTNVRKATPLFKDHDQPKIPADLGYYDLRVPDSREAQARLAREHDVEGFCYWHYWFGHGRRLLERPFNEVLASGKPDFPFCLAWANHSWKDKTFNPHGSERVLIEQLYPGREDHVDHFNAVLPALQDRRYILVDGKPLVYIYSPGFIPDVGEFIALWRQLAAEHGLPGLHFVAQTYDSRKVDLYRSKGFDAVNLNRLFDFADKDPSLMTRPQTLSSGEERQWQVVDYQRVSKYFSGSEDHREDCYPSVFPNWDPSPRNGSRGHIFTNSTPSAFKAHVLQVLSTLRGKSPEHRIVFLKSWNEWGEGNYIEPDRRFGRGYLESLREALNEAACEQPHE